ncbi:MAG: 50S ribosomal protein L13 [Candidatus Yonathbacteria bacterium]|nr:50S ribosomal protein L13 [Candidatus Yonathbacteria bacterium]
MTTTTIHTIDATGRTIGRVATEAAASLRGKNSPSFERHTIPTSKVEIINASKLSVSDKKTKQKTYRSYSGYPGGLKTDTLESVIAKKGYQEVLIKAITRMLARNSIRPIMMKNLKISL